MNRDEKKIYEILNNIDLQDEIDEFKDISEFEKEKIKRSISREKMPKNKKMKNSKINVKVMAAGLALMIGVTSQTSFGKDTINLVKSKLYDINYSVSSFLRTDGDSIQDYSSVVNKVVEDKGINIKLTDVIIDNDEIIISSLIEDNNEDKEKIVQAVRPEYKLFIDGKEVEYISATGSLGKVEGEDNIFESVMALNIADMDMNDDVEVRYVINELHKTVEIGDEHKHEKVKGRWEYEFKANTSELKKDTKSINIDEIVEINGSIFNFKSLLLNPVSQEIRGSIDKNQNINYIIKLTGQNDLGEDVEFYLSSNDEDSFIFKYENYKNPFNFYAEEINLDMYINILPKESGRLTDVWKKVDGGLNIKLN